MIFHTSQEIKDLFAQTYQKIEEVKPLMVEILIQSRYPLTFSEISKFTNKNPFVNHEITLAWAVFELIKEKKIDFRVSGRDSETPLEYYGDFKGFHWDAIYFIKS